MQTHTTPAQIERGTSLTQHEEAALRRVAAHMNTEAAELPPTGWVAEHLRLRVDDWGEQVLPQLFDLMAGEDAEQLPGIWVRRRSDHCPLSVAEEASLRRLAAILRAEAVELGRDSEVGARLDSWGIQLAVECERPTGMRRI